MGIDSNLNTQGLDRDLFDGCVSWHWCKTVSFLYQNSYMLGLVLEFKFNRAETLELHSLNPDRLMWISTAETFFNSLLLNITFPTTCYKDTFDYKYRYDAITIGLISDWTKVSCSQDMAFRVFKQTMAEFKEFERRFKCKSRFKYGWFHLKLYQMFQDLSRRLI